MMKSSDPKNGDEDVEMAPRETPEHTETSSLLVPNGDGPTKRKTTAGRGGAAPRRTRVRKKKETPQNTFIKYAALILLVAQMVGLVLLMRYTRTHRDPEAPLYLASTAVFLMEVMKFVICVAVVVLESGVSSISELWRNTVGAPMEMLKLSIPSLLYTVQNNLLYLALTNLDAATYQVCYQLKILTTALFSALLLGRKFSRQKWFSLLILTVGVAVVQVSGSGDQHSDASDGENSSNRVVGLIAVLSAACTSGFSGVYFEKILKGSTTSLWIRNIQMGLPSILISYVTIYLKDAEAVRQYGLLGGYNNLVWSVVIVQAVGGLIVATVVKYADNILKTFAASFSIVVSCLISAVLFDFAPSISFLFGASLVVTATAMYSSPERRKKSRRSSTLPVTVATSSTSPRSRKQ